MQIALDARNLLNSENGIGRTILCSCSELTNRGVQLSYYWPERPNAPHISQTADTQHHFSNFKSNIGRIIWSHTVLPRQINATRPDIFWGLAHRLPSRVDPSIPCVVTIHDLVWAKYPQTMRRTGWLADRLLAPHAMARADAIIAVSHSTKRDIVERYPAYESKTHVVHPGVSVLTDPDEGAATKTPASMEGDFALFVGTLEPRKNLATLLEALALLKDKGQLTGQLCIAGGRGWRHANIEDMIKQLDLSSHIRAVGYVSDGALDALYSKARFLVMPSLYEGFGIPIIEANHYGLPVLTSNVSSMPEAAGKSGLLINPMDPHDIARGWQQLWQDNELYGSLAAEAKPNAARFSWKQSVNKMQALFEALITKHT